MKVVLVGLAVAACAHAPPATPIPHLPPISAGTCSPPIAEPYTKLAGVRVARVDVRGVGFDAATMTKQLATKPGVPLDPDTLAADVRTLWALGVASQVAVTAEPSPDGYTIELAVVPMPHVVRVEITGATRAQLATLAALEGTLHDQGRLSRLSSATQLWFRGHGYPRAELAGESIATCDGVVVRIDVKLGRRYTLSRLAVTGSALPAPAAMFEHDFGVANVVGGEYHEALFGADLEALAQRHRDTGYLDAKALAPVVHFDDRAARVSVDARIEAGARFKVALAIEGGTPAQRALVEAAYGRLRGTWFDRDAQDDAYDRLDNAFAPLQLRFHTVATRDHGTYKLTIVIREDA